LAIRWQVDALVHREVQGTIDAAQFADELTEHVMALPEVVAAIEAAERETDPAGRATAISNARKLALHRSGQEQRRRFAALEGVGRAFTNGRPW
jgi:hypothetical protein